VWRDSAACFRFDAGVPLLIRILRLLLCAAFLAGVAPGTVRAAFTSGAAFGSRPAFPETPAPAPGQPAGQRRSDGGGALAYAATYEAFGTRTQEAGASADRQRANTKEEDSLTGLLNEGQRYRDLATGMFLTRDPAGFVDGPNVYTYVNQNPWSAFDEEGLFLNFIAQAGVGALIGGGLEAASQLIVHGRVNDWGAVGKSAAVGAVGAVTGGIIGQVAVKVATMGKVANAAVKVGQAANRASDVVENVESVVQIAGAVASGDPQAAVQGVLELGANNLPAGGKGKGPAKTARTTGGGDGPPTAAKGGDSYVYGVIDTQTGTLTKPGMSSGPIPDRMKQD